MKYIISEDQSRRLSFLRRLDKFENYLTEIIVVDYPCNYESADDYANILIEDSVLRTFEKDWDDYENYHDFELMGYLKEKYYDALVENYEKEKCNE